MNSTDLGKKIKEARISKKMTQSEVVGDFITRNMLSQIESGNACPSVKTLEYLAKKLEIPINYLIPYSELTELPQGILSDSVLNDKKDKLDEDNTRYITILTNAKKFFLSKAYQKAIDELTPHRDRDCPIYDECAAISARAYLELALFMQANGDKTAAAENARLAGKFASQGIYATKDIKTSALLLLDSLTDDEN